MKNCLLLFTILFFTGSSIFAQCPTGEVQVRIHIATDSYGGEGYWQLVPAGSNCGSGTIASGGNITVGCNGGGLQNGPSGGYPNNTTIQAGPWCLPSGNSYDIIYVDDYGDGGLVFRVDINGFPVYQGLTGSGSNITGTRLNFTATPPPAFDLRGLLVGIPSYVVAGSNTISGTFTNLGTDTITSLDLHYSINSGSTVTGSLPSLSLAPFTSDVLTHPVQWNDTTSGLHTIKMWASGLNGNPDSNPSNDTAVKTITMGPGIPNIIDDYIGITPILTVIGSSVDGISVPRDLDFHPVLSRYELWVINKSTENSGGETVKFTNAGKPGQTSLLQQDGNAWHFMSLPTGIAFSDNENFATSPGVFDANHNGGSPFTGPALWSSDPLIYAQPSGGNGSHLDMLHESPHSMGICHEKDNVFWVYDGYNGDVVRYDFVDDHGPGADDHSDAIIRRYKGLSLQCDPTYHIPSHLVLDKQTGTLYIVDTNNDRILKMDIHSGVFTSPLTGYEFVQEYSRYDSADWSVFANSGLVSPSGIDFHENRLIVSDYATGEIIIYNITGSGTELGRIVTGTPGIMGVKIGPDGKIWYVNANTNQVIRIDGLTLNVQESVSLSSIELYPNPARNEIHIHLGTQAYENIEILVFNSSGKMVMNELMTAGMLTHKLKINNLSSGIYAVSLRSGKESFTSRFVKE